MEKILKIERDLKKSEFTKSELKWLETCIQAEFKKGIQEKRIIFSNHQGKHQTYFLSRMGRKRAPSRFLKSNLLFTIVPGKEVKRGFIVKLDLLYWYLDNMYDLWDYKELAEPLFDQVFRVNPNYIESQIGYQVRDAHLTAVALNWGATEKTLFIGYLLYLRLLQNSTVPPLVAINEGLKKKTLESFGVTIACREAFGMVTHREILGVCWNCGDPIECANGLCSDCDDYWDRKTR